MSKDIFEIINPTNTLGVCRPLAHILGACETIVYNAHNDHKIGIRLSQRQPRSLYMFSPLRGIVTSCYFDVFYGKSRNLWKLIDNFVFF